jgi:hypothetical protein
VYPTAGLGALEKRKISWSYHGQPKASEMCHSLYQLGYPSLALTAENMWF